MTRLPVVAPFYDGIDVQPRAFAAQRQERPRRAGVRDRSASAQSRQPVRRGDGRYRRSRHRSIGRTIPRSKRSPTIRRAHARSSMPMVGSSAPARCASRTASGSRSSTSTRRAAISRATSSSRCNRCGKRSASRYSPRPSRLRNSTQLPQDGGIFLGGKFDVGFYAWISGGDPGRFVAVAEHSDSAKRQQHRSLRIARNGRCATFGTLDLRPRAYASAPTRKFSACSSMTFLPSSSSIRRSAMRSHRNCATTRRTASGRPGTPQTGRSRHSNSKEPFRDQHPKTPATRDA